jgi:hypothetical protein
MHRNIGKNCKPDPTTNGKDCDIHGNIGVGDAAAECMPLALTSSQAGE